MSSSALDNEDLDNVPLVRMEDVQPSRDRIARALDNLSPLTDVDEEYETCIRDEANYDINCVVDDDSDSNIGSMVSIKSAEIADDYNSSDSGELIVPEVLQPPIRNKPTEFKLENTEAKPQPPDSWPTLEILPGGVIKNANEYESDLFLNSAKVEASTPSKGEMKYACAKCSQVFKHLFCLVKHVKWHEEQQKIQKDPNLKKIQSGDNTEYTCLHSRKKKIVALDAKTNRRKLPKRLKSKS